MKKSIALFINSMKPGGAERVVSRISYELEKKYNVFIFLVADNKQFYKCAGKIVILGKNRKSYRVNAIYAVLNINKQIKKYNIECVISFLDGPNIINSLFNKSARKVISIRDCSAAASNTNFAEKIKRKICQYTFHKSDAMISVSKELNEKSVVQYGFNKDKAYTIENPYDVYEILKCAEEKIEKDLLEFIQIHKTAVAVGRLNEQKGYDDLFEIFDKVIKKCPDAALIILGEGALKEKLEELLKGKGLQDCVKLIGVKENPFAYMSKCMLYVSTSRHEGFPNTLVEAMACGLPALHTDCMTGPREIFTDNEVENISESQFLEYGVLVPTYARGIVTKEIMQNMYTDAWVKLIQDENLLRTYSVKAMERAKKYNFEICISKYMNVIEETTK